MTCSTPATELPLNMALPHKSLTESQDNSPFVIKTFFEKLFPEHWLYVVHT
jgi:hypothetical protein